jgi:hypothetical protein
LFCFRRDEPAQSTISAEVLEGRSGLSLAKWNDKYRVALAKCQQNESGAKKDSVN